MHTRALLSESVSKQTLLNNNGAVFIKAWMAKEKSTVKRA